MAAKTHVRLHFKDGDVVTETMLKLAHENCVTLRQAHQIVDLWVEWGDLVERPDGGYDVIRKRARKDAQTLKALGIQATH